jgi:hypothetical protein
MINMKNNNLIEKEDKLTRRIVLKAKTIKLKNTAKVICEVNSNVGKTAGKAVLAEVLTAKLVKTGLDLVMDNELITMILALGAGFMAGMTVADVELKRPENNDELKLKRVLKKYTNENIKEMKNIKEIKELAELLDISEEAVFNLMFKRN